MSHCTRMCTTYRQYAHNLTTCVHLNTFRRALKPPHNKKNRLRRQEEWERSWCVARQPGMYRQALIKCREREWARCSKLTALHQTLGSFCCAHIYWKHAAYYVIDILQASAVTGYTWGSYSIRSRGAAEVSNWITAECISCHTSL